MSDATWTRRKQSDVGVSPNVTVFEHGATMRGRSDSVTDGDRLLAASIDELGTIDTFGVSRRGGGRGAVEILVPARFGRPVLLTEDLESGRWAWRFPQRGAGGDHRFVFDVPGAVTERTDAAARVLVKVVALTNTDRLADTANGWSITKWEAVHRRPLPVTFPQTHSPHTVEATDLKPLLDGASLLLLHDVFGTTASTFGAIPRHQRLQLDGMYEHRVWGFDHPTLTIGPKENASALAEFVDRLRVEARVDILAVGRGGLVAAELAAVQSRRLEIDSITFVGTPLGGTALTSSEHVRAFLDRYTNLLALIPENPIAATLDAVCALATHLAEPEASALDGLEAMASGFDGELPLASATVAGDSANRRRTNWARRLEDAGLDALLGPRHDEVVGVEQATTPSLDNDSVVTGVSHRELVAAKESAELIARFLGVGPTQPLVVPQMERGRRVEGARKYSRVVPNASRDRMHLSVVHGTIALEAGTVLVGHVLGTGLTGSEAAIDVRTRGRMSLRHFARLYPESLGESELLANSVADGGTDFPKRVVIVGLGTPEELTKVGLADTVTAGLLKLALAEAERPTSDPVRVIDLSTPLIGTGGIAPLPVETSITAIVDGILAANSRLREMQLFGERVFDRIHFGDLRFIELQEDVAEIASRTVGRIGELVRAGGTEHVEFVSSPQVEVGVGGWPRRLALDSDPDWQRVVVRQPSEAQPPDRPTITFTLIGRSAATGEERVRPNVAAVAKLLEEVADPTSTKSAATLYRLLVPHRLRSELEKADNLHFIVDGGAAAYPWELLISGDSRAGGEVAISRRAGFIRQFIDRERSQRRPNLGDRRRALVIGNPPTDYVSLEGAYSEAGRIADRLDQYGFATNLMRWSGSAGSGNSVEVAADAIDVSARILGELSGGSYRILHVAAHGVVTDDNPDRTGIVIGTDSYVTADDVDNLDDVSELVFLNCCHLAAKPALAANLARAFMQSGSQAVIAAGWPVGDDSAERFADRFYQEMLEGASFGAAVRQARRAAFSGPGDTTWAAYQCYGDPGYRLQRRRPRFAGTSRMVSGAEFLRAIDIIRVRASDVGRRGSEGQAKTRATLLAELSSLHDSQLTAEDTPSPWLNAVAYAALGETAFELGGFARAIEWYSESLKPDKALGPVKALEQLGNAQVRYAAQLARLGEAYQDLLDSSLENLEAALRLGATIERYSLLGGHWKKRAVIAGRQSATTSGDDEPMTSRDEALKKASGYYAQAAERSPQSSYPVFNWIQLAYLSDGCSPDPGMERFRHAKDESTDESGNFWQRAAAGDAALTRVVIGEFDDESTNRRKQAARAVEHYCQAFELRSSWRERDSVLEHLRDLIALSEGETATALAELLQQLLDAIHELGQDE